MFACRKTAFNSLRFYSTSPPQKPSLKLVAELRKLTEVSITKAREALSATENNVTAALEWLEKDLAVSGAKKAAKVEGRTTGEGVISISVLSGGAGQARGSGAGGVRGAMIELNCETDFVGRNILFSNLAADIAHTAAFISEPSSDASSLIRSVPLEALTDAPLIPRDPSKSGPASASATVGTSIRDMIAKVGEKVSLRRAAVVVQDPTLPKNLNLRLASYLHNSVNLPSEGKIGSLIALALKSSNLQQLMASESFCAELQKLERSLARQTVGFDTQRVKSLTGEPDELALYDQPFAMYAANSSGETVRAVLSNWAKEHGLVSAEETDSGLEVLEFTKWTVGGPMAN